MNIYKVFGWIYAKKVQHEHQRCVRAVEHTCLAAGATAGRSPVKAQAGGADAYAVIICCSKGKIVVLVGFSDADDVEVTDDRRKFFAHLSKILV